MEAFLFKFENYALLAVAQAEHRQGNHLASKGRYALLQQFKADLEQAGMRKQLLDVIQKGMVEWVKQKDPNTMDIKTGGKNKCFN